MDLKYGHVEYVFYKNYYWYTSNIHIHTNKQPVNSENWPLN